MLGQIFVLLFLALVTATKTEPSLPILKLPWGWWEATVHENDEMIYVFRDVRFGVEPKRFKRSALPDTTSDEIQPSDQYFACPQVDISKLAHPPGGKLRLGDPKDKNEKPVEDCLFCDIYVPRSALQSNQSDLLPVIVWIYGGGYVAGSKNANGPLNSGQSILKASNYQTIFITGNYRVGAFGWLAGDYMQTPGVGQPNAGLYDQALLLEMVHKHVDQVKGDKTRVTAWGESAGAGSILHHLIREDGTQDPLFKTFAVQSPAFQWAWDNSPNGELDTIYLTFSNLSGCGWNYDIDCLRNAPLEKLEVANQMLFDNVRQTGLFPVGPAVDGDWVKSIPTVAFSQGHYWKDVNSTIISHCSNESFFFTPNVGDQVDFDQHLYQFLPGDDLESVRNEIRKQYNCTEKYHSNFRNCLAAIIQDAFFTCNTRYLFQSYPTVSYMMKYSFPSAQSAFHAVDLIPLFTNNKQEIFDIVYKVLVEIPTIVDSVAKLLAGIYAGLLGNGISQEYRNYFASFALSGNPNEGPSKPHLTWPVADGSQDELSKVMEVRGSGFHLTNDNQNTNSTCSFWEKIAQEIMDIQMHNDGGRVPQPLSHIGEL